MVIPNSVGITAKVYIVQVDTEAPVNQAKLLGGHG